MLIEQQGDITIIAPRKSVDVSTAPELEQFIVNQIDNGARNMIIDLSQVDYISSVGLRVMLLAAKKLRKLEGTVIFSGLNDLVLEVFELTGLTKVLTTVKDIASAKSIIEST